MYLRVKEILGKYRAYKIQDGPMEMQDIIAKNVVEAFKGGPNTAGGMDGWQPSELALFLP